MKLELALKIMDKCAEQAQFSVPKQAMESIRKALSGSEKPPTNISSVPSCPGCGVELKAGYYCDNNKCNQSQCDREG